MIALTPGTLSRIRALFAEHDREAVAQALVERCGDNLPLVHTGFVSLTERIRFAVLKLSDGDLGQLERYLYAASRDWRDVLLAAGFGVDVGAHLRWHPEPGPHHVSRHAPAGAAGEFPSKERKP